MSRTLTIREIYDAALTAGFTPHQAVTWTAIAMAESGGRTGALNDNGEHSVGLWQINVNADSSRATRWGDLSTPEGNARAAFAISRQGRDMRPWTTTHDRNKGTGADYRRYLGNVEQEIGVAGDPRGVHDYGSTPLTPLTEQQYDRIDAGRPLVEPPADTSVVGTGSPGAGNGSAASGSAGPAQSDTDSDGLPDQFEKLAGTRVDNQDTDSDGLTDAYETIVSRTNPLLADSDGDGTDDAAEIAEATAAGTAPTTPATGEVQPTGGAGTGGSGASGEAEPGGGGSAASETEDADADGLSDRTETLVGTSPTAADTDADGLSDSAEASLGTNPTVADSDADGVTDDLEIQTGTDPLGSQGGPFDRRPTPAWTLQGAAEARAGSAAAAVGQASGASTASAFQIDAGAPVGGLPGASGIDLDTDSDGLTDAFEKLAGTDPTKADTDADGLLDGREATESHTDPLAADTDGDDIPDLQELAQGTDAGRLSGVAGVVGSGRYAQNVRGGVADTDHDGLSDRTEELAGTNAKLADTDGDDLSDAAEASLGTDPTRFDTDLDGVSDGVEIQFGSDPLDASSTLGGGTGVGSALGSGTADPSDGSDVAAAAEDLLGTGSSGAADAVELG